MEHMSITGLLQQNLHFYGSTWLSLHFYTVYKWSQNIHFTELSVLNWKIQGHFYVGSNGEGGVNVDDLDNTLLLFWIENRDLFLIKFFHIFHI